MYSNKAFYITFPIIKIIKKSENGCKLLYETDVLNDRPKNKRKT